MSPEARGQNLTVTARFTSVLKGRNNEDITSLIAPARASITTISSTNNDNGNGNGTWKWNWKWNGTGNGNGNGTGNGDGMVTVMETVMTLSI